MSKRISITIPDSVNRELEDYADQEGRSVSNLVSFLVEYALRLSKEKGMYKPNYKKDD